MALAVCNEEITVRLVAGRMPDYFFELCKERNRVHRHPNVDLSGELSANAAHTFSGRSFALGGLSLQKDDVTDVTLGQMIGDACADDSCADDDDVGNGPGAMMKFQLTILPV